MRKCPAMTPSGPKSCITVRSLKFHSKKGPKVWYFTLNKFLDTILQQSLVAIFFEINEMLRQILKASWKISHYSHIQFWCQITQSSSISLGVKISKFESIWEHTFALKKYCLLPTEYDKNGLSDTNFLKCIVGSDMHSYQNLHQYLW